MSGIDDVIQRSRQAGEFSERKRFTVARSRAIQKLRRFALAHSSYYVLEWIQAAIANGATFLDLAIEPTEVRMSYVGGGFSREELEALFDFLFASKDDLDVADVRQLALGVNALFNSTVENVVIESGDGTLAGTTRVELDGSADSVYVGTPTMPLEGTFVRATGLRRDWGTPMELTAIEDRCLTATIPILVNNRPLFGYSSVRSPDLFGYRRTLKFDEGDLYGTIGIATTPITRNFKLLTFGTWIVSTRWEFDDLPPMGGVVGYDRLRKTADHANIVQDDVYMEMWARLSAYARQLAAGQTGAATFDAAMLDGPAVTAQQFRDVVREHGRVVLFGRAEVTSDEERALAARYGEAFDAPVFIVGPRDRETAQHLGGPDVEVYTPRLDREELRFFERPIAEDPARPWLTAAVEVTDLGRLDFARQLEEVGGSTPGTARLVAALRGGDGVQATVFTPATLHSNAELWIELRIARRVVWCDSLPSAYPGHHIVAELKDVDIDVLLGDVSQGARAQHLRPLVGLVAETIAAMSERALAEATSRVIEAIRFGEPLSFAARRIVLGVVCRSAIKRLRRTSTGVAVRFALESDALPDELLELGLLETLDGRALSLRDLEAMLPDTHGLVYGTRHPNAVPSDYDRSRILHVDEPMSRMLVGLLGHQSFVELGDDATLAEHGGLRCGEFTIGLREKAAFPLIADGDVPEDEVARSAAIEALATQLRARWAEDTTSRHLLRHLIWYVLHGAGQAHSALIHEPLFRAADGRALSFADIRTALDSPSGLTMYDGWSGDLRTGSRYATAEIPVDTVLAMDPYVFHVLSRVGQIRPVLDVDLTAAEARTNPASPSVAFLEREEPGMGLIGTIGIPMRGVEDPVVLWLHREQGTAVALRDIGSEYGVVGRLVGPASLDLAQVNRQCVDACQHMYDRLIRRISSIASDTDLYRRALEVVLSYASRCVRFTEGPDKSLSVTVIDPIARRILDLPIFPSTAGVAVTGWRLLNEFSTYGDRRPRPGRAELSPNTPAVATRWLDDVLDLERVTLHPTASPAIGGPSELDRWLATALHELRTDDDERVLEVRVLAGQQFARWTAQFGVKETELFVDNVVVYVNADCWLVRNLLATGTPPDAEAASWLLLAIYARVNKLRLSVTNVHELHFQSRVLDWLER